MAKRVQGARFIHKYTENSGVQPTIPPNNDHTTGWLDTDIYKGELFFNLEDNRAWTRTISGINEIPIYDGNDFNISIDNFNIDVDNFNLNGNSLNFTGELFLDGIKNETSATAQILYYNSSTNEVTYDTVITSVDLGATPTGTQITITNTAGTNAILGGATDSLAGLVTTGTQTWTGNKTFNGNISFTSTTNRTISMENSTTQRMLSINGHENTNSAGGVINIVGGTGETDGGDVNITGGEGKDSGGKVDIRGGNSPEEFGNVYIGVKGTNAIYLGESTTLEEGTPGANEVLYVDTSDEFRIRRGTVSTSVDLDTEVLSNQVRITNTAGENAVLEGATNSLAGLVTTEAQTWTGNKTFNGDISFTSTNDRTISIAAGDATRTLTISGNLNNEGPGGIVNIRGGYADSGLGGNVNITGGIAGDGDGGDIWIHGGNGDGGDGGDIWIRGGFDEGGSGTKTGLIVLGDINITQFGNETVYITKFANNTTGTDGSFLTVHNTSTSTAAGISSGIKFRVGSGFVEDYSAKGAIFYRKSFSGGDGRGEFVFALNSVDNWTSEAVLADAKMTLKNNGDLDVIGDISAENLSVGTDISAGRDIHADNDISSGGNINVDGNITADGTIETKDVFVANGDAGITESDLDVEDIILVVKGGIIIGFKKKS